MPKFPRPESTATRLTVAAISLTVFTCALAVIAWGSDNRWQLLHLTTYQVFPIFGLLAFSMMWSQCVIAAIGHYYDAPKEVLKPYFNRTGWLVLGAILLHPGLLIAQRFHDGYGLPPGSYETYVAPMQRWIVILGSLSLLVFLAFELQHWFGQRSWWKYIAVLNDIALAVIFYHGLRLGQDLSGYWYQMVWYVYGVVLLAALAYKYYHLLNERNRFR